MNRLSDNVLHNLFTYFMAATTDEKRRSIVDQLGTHPANHARFGHHIGKLHVPAGSEGRTAYLYLWQNYLDALEWLGAQA